MNRIAVLSVLGALILLLGIQHVSNDGVLDGRTFIAFVLIAIFVFVATSKEQAE